jgi:hypothetical protein
VTLRTWEQQKTEPWTLATAIYSRTIAIHRPGVIAAPGATNVATLVNTYSGETIAAETVLFTGIPASIQYKDRDLRPTSPLPADTTRPGGWNVYVPASAGITPGDVTENDLIIAENGDRYQVEAAYPNIMGWKFHCRFLKA